MLRIAVVGCGRWGPNHIRAFQAIPGSLVVAAVDADAERLERAREQFPGIHCERDYERVLLIPDLDAVLVATPTGTHGALVRKALEKGKHVLCEKPLCENGEEARSLVELARDVKRILMVGHV